MSASRSPSRKAAGNLRFAIIENEFGEVGVDDGVIKQASEEQVIETMNGCICCTVRGDLAKVLTRLWQQRMDKKVAFDAVIIETTGLADSCFRTTKREKGAVGKGSQTKLSWPDAQRLSSLEASRRC